MKNYYDLKKQLELCTVRLDTLHEQKELLKSFLAPRTFKIDIVTARGNNQMDTFAIYAHNMASIEKQISYVEKEIDILKRNLKRMDSILHDVDSNLYKIFVYRYIDGLCVDRIAKKTNFSTRRVYQLLSKIEKIINS